MNLAEARRKVWERLALKCRIDANDTDWFEEGYDEFDTRRMVKASEQVAETIEHRLFKTERGGKQHG